jgi:3-hydroxyisobutyrate dehydrogenase-like beta-hydroxyacid dehydrogenase
MCYASLTKGLTALATEALTAATVLGLDGQLMEELQDSQAGLLAWIERSIPSMPSKAGRWIGEMEEIAATFDAAGLPPDTMRGAAALYSLVSRAALDQEVSGAPAQQQAAAWVSGRLAAHLSQPGPV